MCGDVMWWMDEIVTVDAFEVVLGWGCWAESGVAARHVITCMNGGRPKPSERRDLGLRKGHQLFTLWLEISIKNWRLATCRREFPG